MSTTRTTLRRQGRGLGRPLARPVIGVAAAAALLLSGCGASGWNPGVGIRAGDATVTSDHLDEVTSAYCEAIEEQLTTQQQVIPGRFLRGGIAGQLALATAAEEFADNHGVEVGGDYQRQRASLERAVAELPEDQQEAVLEVETADAYVNEAQVAVGRELLEAEGATRAGRQAALQRGEAAFLAWLEEHQVEIAPAYGIDIVDGQAVPVDTSLSFAVSDVAQRGQADNPEDQEYAAGLPDSQRCG